jgi:O-antigen ligase
MLYLRPWDIVTDNALLLALPRLLAALCFISWLIHPGRHARPSDHASRALVPLLGFSFWLFLSTFQTPTVAATQSDWFSTYFKLPVFFVMCILFIENENSISEFELTLAISALTLMAVRIYQVLTGNPELVRLQSSGTFGDSNDLAAVIVIALPFSLLPVFKKVSHLGHQALGFLYGGMAIYAIWLSQSRGALLAMAVQILIVVYRRNKGKKWLGVLFLAGMLGAGYVAALKTMPRNSEDMRQSSENRITYWKAATKMTLQHPILGVGFGEFSENVWQHQTAHSSWFLAFAESGIPGGILFVAFFVFALRTAWRNYVHHPAQLISLAGYGAVMSFLSHTYWMNIYLLAGLVMASDSLKERSGNGL